MLRHIFACHNSQRHSFHYHLYGCYILMLPFCISILYFTYACRFQSFLKPPPCVVSTAGNRQRYLTTTNLDGGGSSPLHIALLVCFFCFACRFAVICVHV